MAVVQSTDFCHVAECHVVARARRMCNTHYARFMRNGTLDYVKKPFARGFDSDTEKQCSKCLLVLPVAEFNRSARNKDGLRGTCKACDNSANRKRYAVNPGPVLARQRIRYSTQEYKDQRADYMDTYYALNADAYAERSAERRARIKEAFVDEGITVSRLRELHGDECVFCGRTMEFERQSHGKVSPSTATIEHMTPIIRGGDHSWSNVRLSCWADNSSKNRKTADEYFEYLKVLGR